MIKDSNHFCVYPTFSFSSLHYFCHDAYGTWIQKRKKIVVSTNEDDLKGSISSGIHQLATYCYDIESVSLYLLCHIIKLKF